MANTQHSGKVTKAAKLVFFIYVLFLVYILFFISSRLTTYNNINLIPFATIDRYFRFFEYFTFTNWFLNIFGNIIIFIPFGFLLPVVVTYFNRFWKLLSITLIVTMSVETLQYVTKVGELDIDDVILNTLGSIMGYILYKIIVKIFTKRK